MPVATRCGPATSVTRWRSRAARDRRRRVGLVRWVHTRPDSGARRRRPQCPTVGRSRRCRRGGEIESDRVREGRCRARAPRCSRGVCPRSDPRDGCDARDHDRRYLHAPPLRRPGRPGMGRQQRCGVHGTTRWAWPATASVRRSPKCGGAADCSPTSQMRPTPCCLGHALYGLSPFTDPTLTDAILPPVLTEVGSRLIHVADHPHAVGAGGYLARGRVTGWRHPVRCDRRAAPDQFGPRVTRARFVAAACR